MINGEIGEVTGRIETTLDNITRGAMMRAKVQQYEEGERCSKFFYNQEKMNHNRKTVTRLITDTGEINDKKRYLQKKLNIIPHYIIVQ